MARLLLAFALLLSVAAPSDAQLQEFPRFEINPDTGDIDATTDTYSACSTDLETGFSDCGDGAIAATRSLSPFSVAFGPGINQAVATVNLTHPILWRSYVVRVRSCNATGWTVHHGDSPGNDGFGGDGGQTRHDSESQSVNTSLSIYRSDIGGSGLACQFNGPQAPQGCVTQQYLLRNDFLEFDANTNVANPTSICQNPSLFDFPRYDEADTEDVNRLYEPFVYTGLNRTVRFNGTRVGNGVMRACLVVSTATTPSNAVITSLCGF